MKVGFIGLGNIGRPMAEGLVGPSYELTVFDVFPAAASTFEGRATIASSVAQVAKSATRIGICVRDEKDVTDVLVGPGGLFENCAAGTVIAVHSTVRRATIRQLAEQAKGHGLAIVDAPVSRGPSGSDATKFVCMVGAEPEVLDQIRPFLEGFSFNIIHAGPAVGDGTALKLSNNLITYVEFSAGIEAFRMTDAAGLSRDLVKEVLTATGTLTNSMRQLIDFLPIAHQDMERHTPRLNWTAALCDKDLACALALAEEVGVTLPVTECTKEEFRGELGLSPL